MKTIVVVFTLLSLFASSSLADKKQAQAHKQRARAFEAKGAYDEAIAEYKAAHAADGSPGPLYNIARIYDEKENDPRNAIVFYERFLDTDRANDPANDGIRGLLADAKRRVAAEDDKHRKAEEEARIAAEKEQQRFAVEAHLKQAAAHEQAGLWAAAAEQHLKAFDLDGDPTHIFAAAGAYRKQPDVPRARETYRRYIDRVPSGPNSQEARGTIADLTREIAKVEQAERDQRIAAIVRPRVDKPPLKKSQVSPTWLVLGGALIVTGVVADLLPASGKNGKLDAADFAPPALYGLGTAAIIGGLFY